MDRTRIEAATVRLPDLGIAQGVLVPAGFVLTATHCLGWEDGAGLTLGDHFPISVATKCGKKFRLGPAFADLVTDMAALHELDNQVFPDDADAFEQWREATEPVVVRDWRPAPQESCAAFVLTHEEEWVRVTVKRYGYRAIESGVIGCEFERPMKAGTSGGPVVDESGALLGVISWGTGEGLMPLACAALPRWIMSRMAEAPPWSPRTEADRLAEAHARAYRGFDAALADLQASARRGEVAPVPKLKRGRRPR